MTSSCNILNYFGNKGIYYQAMSGNKNNTAGETEPGRGGGGQNRRMDVFWELFWTNVFQVFKKWDLERCTQRIFQKSKMQFDNAKNIFFSEYIKQFWGCKSCFKRAKKHLLEADSKVRNQFLESLTAIPHEASWLFHRPFEHEIRAIFSVTFFKMSVLAPGHFWFSYNWTPLSRNGVRTYNIKMILRP